MDSELRRHRYNLRNIKHAFRGLKNHFGDIYQYDDYVAVSKALIYAQNYCCGLCGLPLEVHARDKKGYNGNLDHVWPVSDGGYNGPGNLLFSHINCNTKKGQRRPTGCEVINLVAVNEILGVPLKLLEDRVDNTEEVA